MLSTNTTFEEMCQMAYLYQNELALAMIKFVSDDIDMNIGKIARLTLQLDDRDIMIAQLEETITQLNEQMTCYSNETYGGGINGTL